MTDPRIVDKTTDVEPFMNKYAVHTYAGDLLGKSRKDKGLTEVYPIQSHMG